MILGELDRYWWDGNDFVVRLITGEEYRFSKPYPVGISFGGLEYDLEENIALEQYEKRSS